MPAARALLLTVVLASASTVSAAECGYALDPVWETLRPLRGELVADPYNAAFTTEVERIDGLFRELEAWIVEANRLNQSHCEPMVQRGQNIRARAVAHAARCQGEIADRAVYDACVAERAALEQEWQGVLAIERELNALTVPLNARGMDLIARAQAAAAAIGGLLRDPVAALDRYARFVQARGGTADSCRSVSEVIGAVVRRNNGDSGRVVDQLAGALTGAGGSGFTASGFRAELRISGDPALRALSWLALGFRGGATGNDALDQAAAALGRELRQAGNAASLGPAFRARFCGV